MNRHEDDKPRLIRNEREWKEYVNTEMRPWPHYPPEEWTTYDKFYGWIDHPEEYPCMVFSWIEEMDFRPGWDFQTRFFYMEDARDMIIASVADKGLDVRVE